MCVRLALFQSTAILLDKFKSNMVRRHLLERLFFHGLININGSLRGFADLCRTTVRRINAPSPNYWQRQPSAS
jgi:hypothetical protein